jgi:hypothetical protein
MTPNAEFAEIFDELKRILQPYEPKLAVVKDTPKAYYLTTYTIGPSKHPIWFGGAQIGKSYVSFHLIPVYSSPKLLEGMSPALKKRMQGKSCFNFKTVDRRLFSELKALTRAGYAEFKKIEWVE